MKKYKDEIMQLKLTILRDLWADVRARGITIALLFAGILAVSAVTVKLYYRIEGLQEKYDQRIDEVQQDLFDCQAARLADAARYMEEISGLKTRIEVFERRLPAPRKR